MLSDVQRAIFIGCHTDDELVAAGTLHRLARSGCEVHVVTFSPAGVEGDRTGTEKSVPTVLPEWHAALDAIGVEPSRRRFLDFTPSPTLRTRRQEVCQTIYDVCEEVRPDLAFILSPADGHAEHAVVGAESESVLRGRVPHVVRCNFPWNYSIGQPNLFVKLDEEDIRVKMAAINAYQSQAFRYRYSDILMHAAITDGLAVKTGEVEKFELIRAVI